MPLKEFSYRLLNALYERIFKEEMGREAAKFFTGTSYMAIGTLVGALLSFVFSALGARILGPTSFGNLALVLAVSSILAIPIGIGQNALVKYGSAAPDDRSRARLISTFTVLTALIAVGTTAVLVIFSAQLSNVLRISAAVYFFAVAYGVIVAFYTLTTNSLRVLFRIREYALLYAVQSAIVLAAFLIFVAADAPSWQAAVFSIIIADAAIIVIVVVYLRGYIKLRYDGPSAKRILTYAYHGLQGAIASPLIGSVSPLLINTFISTAAVGIYNAYYLPSLTISITLWGIFNAAYFPYVSKSRDKLSIFSNVNRAVPYVVAVLVPLIVLIEFIVFIFYGRQYPFSAELALLFAFAATMCFFYQCYSYLMAAEGVRGAAVNSRSSVITLVVVIGLNLVLLPRLGIRGAPVTLIFAYLAAVVYLVSRRRILSVNSVRPLKQS
jgi:O-antigen/teichoic acid export membrane protein